MQTVVLYTSLEAAQYLNMTRWHFSRLVKKQEVLSLPRIYPPRFLQQELDAYKSRRRTIEQEELAKRALTHPRVFLAERQKRICEALVAHKYPASIARELGVSRQAIHQNLERIRAKLDSVA